MKLQFNLRFHTEFGQSLWISGNIDELGNDDPAQALPMEYLDNESWTIRVAINRKSVAKHGVRYRYFLKTKEGDLVTEWGNDKVVDLDRKDLEQVEMIDTWNHAGEFENSFYTAPFNNVLLKHTDVKLKSKSSKNFTHVFRVKAPLLRKHEVVCLLGNEPRLHSWKETDPVLLSREGNWWSVQLNLVECSFPIAYKYGVFNTKESRFVSFEKGDNRLAHECVPSKKAIIIHDGFIRFPNNTWKGAGVAIPVFSLRTRNSFGVGEFTDIKLLVDWANETGLLLIQILPINDTIATNTWVDSYPYAAISAFALHPLYINLAKVAGKKHADKVKALRKKQKQLNELPAMDYEEVIRFKLSMLKELYEVMGDECLSSGDCMDFFNKNQHWLEPYSAFCFFRDKYGTSHFEQWKTNAVYDKKEVDKLFAPKSSSRKNINFYLFVQYHLHLQLKEATDYAHKKGIVLKGDIPIGIYRYGCDAWVAPSLYNMNEQAGAPPDDFTAVGQNWEFPTYNWKRMQEDGFSWWKQRFEQMSHYFDAFRIDHILGFFRIWSVPAHAVQGIMGRFVPCLSVHYIEFGENGLWFDNRRFCKPYINDTVLQEIFGDVPEGFKENYLVTNDAGGYDLQPAFATQRQVEAHFGELDQTENNERLKLGLYDLISNVILFEHEGSRGQEFHFRISMEKTSSFRHLIPHIQQKLQALYVNYFFRRQDDFWKKEAMQKLPHLKNATNMLICGEDLGMVPHCVPDVMKQLGILSLEIQRMPKDINKEFSYPHDAPYLSVITPSTHDMSTLRSWWEENRERTQRFFNHVLGQWGDATYFCEPWINRAIIMQHLYSPAMWAIFQLQDILGMSATLRRDNPTEERINNPAIPKHYWQYRMHLSLEDLIKETEFNKELLDTVENSGR
ncbi:MAG: 4-alpha-glucanotransferase [Chitinophagaceae bacterium]|nr:4-alpha-glucanotransferase [Chitinophagaceae bacterium]